MLADCDFFGLKLNVSSNTDSPFTSLNVNFDGLTLN